MPTKFRRQRPDLLDRSCVDSFLSASPSGTRAKVIHSFGRADELDEDTLKRLCTSIARVVGLEVRDPSRPCEEEPSDVLGDGVQQLRTRNYGVILAVQTLWERLGIATALQNAVKAEGCRVPYEQALLAIVTNRLDEPVSKLGVMQRWLDTVHMPAATELTVDQLYEAMDLLHRHQADIEKSVFFETVQRLNLVVDLIFYDTTTVSFCIDEVDSDEEGLRQYGHSKEGDWKPQVVVALAVTQEGVPVRSWVFAGDTADVSTIEQVKADLREWKLGRVLLVGDAGMNSEDNRRTLARACGRYVLACRLSSVKEVEEEVLGRPGRYKTVHDNLRVKEVVVGDGEKRRRYVVCFNPAQAERERLHREQVVEDLEQELASHEDNHVRRKWTAQLRASKRYGRYLRVDAKGRLHIDRAKVREAAHHDGKWVLITNDDSLSTEEIASAYKSSMVIERGFHTMKSGQIEVRPMYHWVARRIEAHVKLCVLGLLIARVAELACGMTWPRIRDVLATVQVSEFQTPTHRFFRIHQLSPEAKHVLQSLQIKPPNTILAIEARS